MYGIVTYIWPKFMVNVGKYTSPMDPSWVRVTSQTSTSPGQVAAHNFAIGADDAAAYAEVGWR